ncbi:MAG: UMP kinase [Candidatus Thalassarchaeaceae archaeon]|jgi:uridylate kinase|nr:UMP kinase [Candidatus Thalassarchaeaceae archaeon]
MEPPVVVALGGSLLHPDEVERHVWLDQVKEAVSEHVGSGGRIGLVIGGGVPARDAITIAKPLIEDVAALDEIGIAATRLNATIVAQTLSHSGLDVCNGIPSDTTAAARALENHQIVVMGGTSPGHTTDNVAIRLAIDAKATQCIIATNVDYVYDSDPKINSNARSIESMTLEKLQEIVGPPVHGKAGGSGVIDPVGVQAAIDYSLPLAVIDGRKVERLASALSGNEFKGTRITVG